MNVLILTPDRVGSTLLQRLLTVYANINENHNPLTVNLHELTNGLISYHNTKFNQTMLGKKQSIEGRPPGDRGYFQNLETIVNLLDDCKHDVTARLAYYHIKNRKDSLQDQLAFYQYLNDNFYIIACRRKNLFEHAISWAIAGESKNLNVYSVEQKYEIFKDLHKNKMQIQPDVMEKYLSRYDEYLDWVDRHFNVNSYFEYERDLPNIEKFILNLTVFNNKKNVLTWRDRFNISWNDWNRVHYLLSLIPFEHQFSDEEKEFIKLNIDDYTQGRIFIQDLQDDGIVISGIPIKLHTLHEKAELISNIDQCLLNYNKWISVARPSYAVAYHPETLTQVAQLEYASWTSDDSANKSLLTYNDIPKKQLALSDLKWIDD
jgi:hypothetical protein